MGTSTDGSKIVLGTKMLPKQLISKQIFYHVKTGLGPFWEHSTQCKLTGESSLIKNKLPQSTFFRHILSFDNSWCKHFKLVGVKIQRKTYLWSMLDKYFKNKSFVSVNCILAAVLQTSS